MANPLFVARQIADGVITSAKLASGAAIGNIANNAITSGLMASLSIRSSELAALAVTAGKIATGAINASNLFTAGVVDSIALAAGAATSVNQYSFSASAAMSSSTYVFPGSSQLITTTAPATRLMIIQRSALRRSGASARPQPGIRFNGTIYDGGRLEDAGGSFRDSWWIYLVDVATAGSYSLDSGFRSFDNNSDVTSDGSTCWVVQLKR